MLWHIMVCCNILYLPVRSDMITTTRTKEVHLSEKDLERFWKKVDKRGEGECWPWTASTRKGGYGQFKKEPTLLSAHRIAFEVTHRKLDRGELVLHSCDNPNCCNPAHLSAGSQRANVADAMARGRHVMSPNRPQK